MNAYRFVHCSDIHQLSLQGARPHHFLSKRFTGGLNMLFNRRWKYRSWLFERMLEAVDALRVDRLVITGDLSNLALDGEFAHVRRMLDAIAHPVTVIPGNHDTYTRAASERRRFEHHFAPFMEGEREDGADYPFVLRDGPVAFIGLSTAIPTRLLVAHGALGEPQLSRLDRVLGRLAEEPDRRRVVLLHHPVVLEYSRRHHGLIDRDAFAAVIARHGADLILHGHEHKALSYSLPGPTGPVAVHAVPSAIHLAIEPVERRAGFSLYHVGETLRRELYAFDGTRFVPAEAV